MKNKVKNITRDAAKTVETVKDLIGSGLTSSKGLLQKSAFVAETGLKFTSKGMGVVAKGARLASTSAETIAKSMEKASHRLEKVGKKAKPQEDS